MKQFIKDFFTLPRNDRRGILILVILILLAVIAPYFFPLIFKKETYDTSKFQADIDSFEIQFQQKRLSDSLKAIEKSERLAELRDYIHEKEERKKEENKIEYFEFDPNNLPAEKWRKLGIPEWTIRSIKNYEASGGKFRKKEDLKKMYNLKEKDYNRIEPYIFIKEVKIEYVEEKREKKWEPEIIFINTADSAELVKLYGIGPAYSRRILNYRKALGGFIKKDQIKEVWGIADSTYEKIKDQLVLDTVEVEKICLNSDSIGDIKKHPYIKHNVAKAIMNYRKHHGEYTSVGQLRHVYSVNEELYVKIEPYLTVQIEP